MPMKLKYLVRIWMELHLILLYVLYLPSCFSSTTLANYMTNMLREKSFVCAAGLGVVFNMVFMILMVSNMCDDTRKGWCFWKGQHLKTIDVKYYDIAPFRNAVAAAFSISVCFFQRERVYAEFFILGTSVMYLFYMVRQAIRLIIFSSVIVLTA